MENMFVELTDPAHEIAELAQFLIDIESNDRVACEVIGQVIGIAPDSCNFLDLISAANRRVVALSGYVRVTDDPRVGRYTRPHLIDGLERIASIFRPWQLTMPWVRVKSSFLLPSDIAALEMFSAHMRQKQPLRRLSDSQRSELVSKIDQAISDVELDATVPNWMKEPLVAGLRQLQLIISHLVFFGHAQAVEGLFALYHRAVAADRELNKGCILPVARRGLSIASVINIVLVAVAAFSAPDQTLTAFERYRGWYLNSMTDGPHVASPVLQLPPPVGAIPDLTPDEVDEVREHPESH